MKDTCAFLEKTVFNRFWIGMIFFVAAVAYCCAPLMGAVDRLTNVLLAWIAACMVYDFIRTRQPFSRDHVLGLAFTAWFALCALLGGITAVAAKTVVYVLIQTVFLVGIWRGQDRKARFEQMTSLITVLGFAVNVASLCLYFLGVHRTYTNGVIDNTDMILGLHRNGSLYGLLCNSNWTGFFALLVFGLAMYRVMANRGRVFQIINALLAAAVLVNTNSRGSLMGLYVMTAAAVFLLSFPRDRVSVRGLLRTSGALCLAVLMLFSATFALRQVRTGTFWLVGQAVHQQADRPSARPGQFDRDSTEQQSSTQARLDLWKAGGRVVAQHPITGVGYQNIQSAVWEQNDSDQVDFRLAVNTHNIFVQMAVATGVVGLLLFLACIAWPLLRALRTLLRPGAPDLQLIVAVSLVLCFAAVNMVEADIAVSRNFMSTIFWVLVGFLQFAAAGEKERAAS